MARIRKQHVRALQAECIGFAAERMSNVSAVDW
jgi:hypothetical protein